MISVASLIPELAKCLLTGCEEVAPRGECCPEHSAELRARGQTVDMGASYAPICAGCYGAPDAQGCAVCGAPPVWSDPAAPLPDEAYLLLRQTGEPTRYCQCMGCFNAPASGSICCQKHQRELALRRQLVGWGGQPICYRCLGRPLREDCPVCGAAALYPYSD